ncbi:MAG: hypothetical protein JNK87_22470 [Bryobacterales bacterium]|nr:hypothetical protein [Bryobacterales bacterium]
MRGARLALVVAAIHGVLGIAYAQDPYHLAPRNYKLEFENEYVRLSRVTYAPGDKVPEHDHPAWNTVYVYLTDGGPVVFGHKTFAPAKRPAVKAGAVRFARVNRETHDTTYLGEQPSEYYRVELKTKMPPDLTGGRIAAGAFSDINNGQARVERIVCAGNCQPSPLPTVVVDVASRTGRYLEPGAAVPDSKNLIRVVLKTDPVR